MKPLVPCIAVVSAVIAEGLGKSRPIAENDTDLGRALNRRIEVARQDCKR